MPFVIDLNTTESALLKYIILRNTIRERDVGSEEGHGWALTTEEARERNRNVAAWLCLFLTHLHVRDTWTCCRSCSFGYSVQSHLPANYTAYYPSVWQSCCKSHRVMGTQQRRELSREPRFHPQPQGVISALWCAMTIHFREIWLKAKRKWTWMDRHKYTGRPIGYDT